MTTHGKVKKTTWRSGWACTMALTLACTAGSCSKKEKPPTQSTETKDTAPDKTVPKTRPPGKAPTPAPIVDNCGRYKVDVKLPPPNPCKTDADCGWTEWRPGNCHGAVCTHHYRAGNKTWVAAVNKLHARVCTGRKYKQCNRYKCLNTRPKGAVCRNSRCELIPGSRKK